MVIPQPKRRVPAAAPFVERPEILWFGFQGDSPGFPPLVEYHVRMRQETPEVLHAFREAVARAGQRIWIIDMHFGRDEGEGFQCLNEALEERTRSNVAATKAPEIRILSSGIVDRKRVKTELVERLVPTIQHSAKADDDAKVTVRIYDRNNHPEAKSLPEFHDRFAIVDHELWHFGETVGGRPKAVSAVSRGWGAEHRNAEAFFQTVWNILDGRRGRQ